MFVVLCNCPPKEANLIARALVKERLAACVNVIPGITSFYVWEGELQEDVEHTLLIKAPAEALSRLKERIQELHSYETIEILALPVDTERSDAAYVAWVRSVAR